MLFLANLIWTFHALIVLFILSVPFLDDFTKFDFPLILILHITFGICILIHWLGNNNNCSLTLIESWLRKKHPKDTISHQFIAPIYDFSENEWNTVCYIILISLILVSIYKLYHSKKLNTFITNWGKVNLIDNLENLVL
jgi:hypothetical protein